MQKFIALEMLKEIRETGCPVAKELKICVATNLARIIYFLAQFFIFPSQAPAPSILRLDKKRKLLSIKPVELLPKNQPIAQKLSESVSLLFKETAEAAARDPIAYTCELTALLNEDDWRDISAISSDQAILDHARMWLGKKPCLTGISVYANFPNKGEIIEEGSKLWHRDSDVYCAAEYYINLSKCNTENGPLFVFKDPSAHRLSHPFFPKILSKQDLWRRYRWFDDDLCRFSPLNFPRFVESSTGPVGKVTFLDSGIHMHKGGKTERGFRIVMRLTYSQYQFRKPPLIADVIGGNFLMLHPRKGRFLQSTANNLLKLRIFS